MLGPFRRLGGGASVFAAHGLGEAAVHLFELAVGPWHFAIVLGPIRRVAVLVRRLPANHRRQDAADRRERARRRAGQASIIASNSAAEARGGGMASASPGLRSRAQVRMRNLRTPPGLAKVR